jgi:hypothetical protein
MARYDVGDHQRRHFGIVERQQAFYRLPDECCAVVGRFQSHPSAKRVRSALFLADGLTG